MTLRHGAVLTPTRKTIHLFETGNNWLENRKNEFFDFKVVKKIHLALKNSFSLPRVTSALFPG